MTQITGVIADSAGQPLSGVLQVTLDAPMIINDETLTMFGVDFVIGSDGVVNIDVPPSDVSQISYHFVFKTLAVGDVPERVWLDFHALVPSQTTVLLVDLMPTTLVMDVMDTSVIRLAKYITDDPILLAKVRSSFNGRGVWSPTQLYYKDDVVTYDGGSYFYTNKVPSIGNELSNTTYWQPLATRGNNGTGTTGNTTAYNATTWNGQSDAPSRGAIRDLVENLLAKQTDYSALAPKASPALTGTPTTVTPATASNNSTQIANTAWVWQALASILSPASIGQPYAPTVSVNANNTSIANTAWVWSILAPILTPGATSAYLAGTPRAQEPSNLDYSSRIITSKWFYDRVDLFMTPGATAVSLVGTPTATTPASATDNSTRIATTEWVNNWKDAYPRITGMTLATLQIQSGANTIKFAWGNITTTSQAWTAGTEKAFNITLPDGLTITNQVAIFIDWRGSTPTTTGQVQTRGFAGSSGTTFGVGLRTAATVTAAINYSYLVIGY